MTERQSTSSEQSETFIHGLLRPEAFDHPVSSCELIETHISWVILTGEFAYKIKKPVDFGFVDFSTLEKRRFCCEEELRLNRRQTQDLYLAVKPIIGPLDRATFRSSGEPIEYAVQMRQFSQADLLTSKLACGELHPEHLDKLATNLAEFQKSAPIADAADHFGSNAGIYQVVAENFAVLERARILPDVVAKLHAWAEAEFECCESEFFRRKLSGKIREGHGDLHLGNMILRTGQIEVFDCIDSSPELRWGDVIGEVAFLVMDLIDRGRLDLGWEFLNAWFAETGDYAGLKVWAWYFCYRALVRAKVAALRQAQSDVGADEKGRIDRQLREYLQLAQKVTERSKPMLILTHGVSGSGKSHWARRAAGRFGLVWIRSDVERKRLFAEAGTPAAALDLYSTEMTNRTYVHMKEVAQTVLSSGWSILVDATFLQRAQRKMFLELAQTNEIQSLLMSFQADDATLRQRITQRRAASGDPSDATIEVLAVQLKQQELIEPTEGWNVLTNETELQQLLLEDTE